MSGLGARWNEHAKKQTKSVIGRARYLDIFVSLYESCREREATVLNFYGVGGIGKSTILSTIKAYAEKQQIPCFFYDLEKHTSVLDFYEKLYIWLQKAPFRTDYFQMGFLVYWQRMHPNIDFKESLPAAIKEGGLFGDIASVIMDDGLGLVKEAVPVLGGMSGMLYKSYRKLATRYRLEKEMIDYIGEMEESDMEPDEIEMRLPYLLMQDLRRADFTAQPLPLFLFDTYEKLYESATADKRRKLEAWIENFAAGILNRGMLVIAGREKIDWRTFDNAWNDLILSHHVEALSAEEARTLIRTHGIDTPQIVEAITEASKGHPFYIELAIDTYKSAPQSFDAEAVKHAGQEQLFKRFVGNLGSDYLTILEHLSVTRDFDRALYAHILQKAGIGYSQLIFEQLVSYSFFTQKETRYTMHDLMRRSFKTHIAPERLKTLHEIVFTFYDEKIKETIRDNRPLDAEILQNAIYHLFAFANESQIETWFDPIQKRLYYDGNYRLLVQLYQDALAHIRNSRVKIHFMIELALLHIDMDDYEALKARVDELDHTVVPIDLLDDIAYLHTKKNLIYTETKVRMKERERLLKKSEKALLKVIQKSDTAALKSRAYIELANLLRKRREFFPAQSALFTALNFTDDTLLQARIYDKLGYLQRDMKRYDEARRSFIKAVEIKKSILAADHIELGKSYRGLSQILFKLEEIDRACEVVKETIKIFITFYGKWSPIVRNEYKTLIRHCPDTTFRNSDDQTLRLLAQLEIAAASKTHADVTALLETLRSDTEEMMDKYPVMAKILIQNYPHEAEVLLLEAYERAESEIQRWHLTLHAYLIYRSSKRYSDAQKMLDRLVSLSEQMELSRHVSDLQKAAFFYTKIDKETPKAVAYYEKAIKLLSDHGGDRLKAAQLCRFRAKLCGKKYEEKLHWLQKAIEFYRMTGHTHEAAETMSECVQIYISRKAYDTAQSLLYEIIKRYEEAGDPARIDTVYGKLADLYERIGDREKVLACYYDQLRLRQKLGDDFRLAKGYKFLADYLFEKCHDPQKAETFYRKGVDIALSSGKGAEEMIEMHTYTLMRFYQKTGQRQKEKAIIDLRRNRAQQTDNLRFKRLAFKDLEFYHSKAKAYEDAITCAEASLALYPLSKFPQERLAIITRILNYIEYENKPDPHRKLRFMLQKYELLLLTGESEEATAFFAKLTDFTRKNELHEPFLQHYKALLGQFTVSARYNAYALTLSHYRIYDPSTRWYFLYRQIHRFQKLVDSDPDAFHRVHNRLRQINAPNEAALFYERFFELRIAKLKGRFDEQAQLYKEASERLKKLNNQIVTRRFKTRYDAFQTRLANLRLINGRAIDPILVPVLNDLLPHFNVNEPALQRFKYFLKRCEEEPALMERIKERKLNISVILQGIRAIAPNFSPLQYGFPSTTPFFQMLFCKTQFQLARANSSGATYVIARDDNRTDWEILPDLTNPEAYIHEKANYAKLLSAAFLEGKGLYFSKNPLLEQRFYRFVCDASFVQATFDEILQTVLENLQIEEEQDRKRIENLIRNLYYADCFLIENRYETLKAQIVTQKVSGEELQNRLKEYGKTVLQKMVGEVDERVYEMLWL